MHWSGLQIALVGPLPPPAGGMANQTRQLAELLEREGARVELVQVNRPYRPRWIGRIPGLRAVFRLLPYLFRLWTACGRADLVHVMANSGLAWYLFATPAVWIAAARGVPVVVNYRGGGAERFLAAHERRVQFTLRRAAQLLLPSGFLLDVFARHGIPGRVVPNIVDTARFSAASRQGAGNKGPHLVVARNLEPIYGNDVALEALALLRAHLPGSRLTLAGSGPERGALLALAARLGVEEAVNFTGRLDREQMAELYRQSDLMLNPTRVDNMPNAVLEGLASGLPVICTRVGGVPYIVEHRRTALLVAVDDPRALADAVLEVWGDTALREQLVRNGLAEVLQYRWEAVREQLWLAYADALGANFATDPA